MKVTCAWSACKHNTASKPSTIGDCVFEGTVELVIPPYDDPDDDTLICNSFEAKLEKFWEG